MSTVSHTRQLDWFNPAEHDNASVTMYGCGGIGSFTALALAKLGVPKLVLVDFDSVEAHNIPNQMFSHADAGRAKVEAIETAVGMTDESIDVTSHECSLVDAPEPSGVVISGLDSMAARVAAWKKIQMNRRVPLYLDARLGGESIVVYAVSPMDLRDIEGYEATLHSDAEAREVPCTRRSIIDVGFAVASLLVRAVRMHYAMEPLPRITFLDQAGLNLYTQERW